MLGKCTSAAAKTGEPYHLEVEDISSPESDDENAPLTIDEDAPPMGDNTPLEEHADRVLGVTPMVRVQTVSLLQSYNFGVV